MLNLRSAGCLLLLTLTALFCRAQTTVLTSPVGIGTTTPATPLEVKTGGIDQYLTGTHYVEPLNMGAANDYGSGGALQYILLFPFYNGTVGETSAGMSGRLRFYRGASTAYNIPVEYEIVGQTAYSTTSVSLLPKTVLSPMVNLYSVTYQGIPYLAVYGRDVCVSAGEYTFEGFFWNNINTTRPQLVLASACSNVTLIQNGEFVAGPIYSTNTGQVGINTANPQGYTLAVNGPAIFTQATVKNYANWPDYVFSPDYRPMDLDSLQRYVLVNRHLPGIPTEEEVAQKGIDLGEMNKRLLEKVEELTRYVLEEHREIVELRGKLEEQRRK
ncbi:hypothetical protein [Dinghuibacter silviterrae]|uniref:Uncharacterized protein n=1 Tax=Dinghuibacter silviterrae TaxID=1539049 RepID=A0A4R8DV11_9BACT|nr:hypothetical protein [Dinghuibacter silviterrae]TDX02234.1 hypothetical protein EDB95_3288 [Dinghuibacter silviterrae]